MESVTYEYIVLVTSLPYEVDSIIQLYRGNGTDPELGNLFIRIFSLNYTNLRSTLILGE